MEGAGGVFSSHLYAPVNDPAGGGTRVGIWEQEGMMEGGMRLPLETSLASRHVKVGAGRGRGGEIRWCVGKRGRRGRAGRGRRGEERERKEEGAEEGGREYQMTSTGSI